MDKTINTILDHSYLDALDKKKITKDKLEIFVCEQYHIISNDKRNFALMISKTSNDTVSNAYGRRIGYRQNKNTRLRTFGRMSILYKFESCFDSQKYKSFIENDIALAHSLGFTETPSFIVAKRNGSNLQKIEGPQPFVSFKAVIDKRTLGA